MLELIYFQIGSPLVMVIVWYMYINYIEFFFTIRMTIYHD